MTDDDWDRIFAVIRVNAVACGAIHGRWLKGGMGEGYDADPELVSRV